MEFKKRLTILRKQHFVGRDINSQLQEKSQNCEIKLQISKKKLNCKMQTQNLKKKTIVRLAQNY